MVFAHINARAIIWGTTGAFCVKRERPEGICYKKYLGDSWEADYDGMRCGTVISNHGAFIDSLMHSECQLPSFIAKESVKRIPGIGQICRVSQCFFLDRSS